MIKLLLVNLRRDRGVREDRLDLRGKDKASVPLVKVERLDAHPVTHEHEPLARRVPQSDAVVALDLMHELKTALFVEVQDRLRVSARMIDVPASF